MEASEQLGRSVFEEGFCARDIAQALPSFDGDASLDAVQTAMQKRSYEIAGVRTEGMVTGYIESRSLSGQLCRDCQQPFAATQLITDDTPLVEVVRRLKLHAHCFVVVWGQPCGYVCRNDLQKPPGRMWLFGVITHIESRFIHLIKTQLTEDEWKACMSPGRLQKAESLWVARRQNHRDLALADCLQFADMATIVSRSERLRRFTRFESKKQIEKIGSRLEKLRNNLAHSQNIIQGDWETIVMLADNLAFILNGP